MKDQIYKMSYSELAAVRRPTSILCFELYFAEVKSSIIYIYINSLYTKRQAGKSNPDLISIVVAENEV